MIIECTRCRTTYRFDEEGIEGDGAWVRCSRCRLVFFQDLPDREIQTQQPGEATDVDEPVPDRSADKPSYETILSRTEEFRKAVEQRETASIHVEDEEWEEDDLETVAKEEREIPPEGVDEGKGGSIWARLALYLLIAFFLAGGIYLWLFPQVRQQAVLGLSTLPVVDRLFVGKQSSEEAGPSQVTIKDVRQRFIANWLMGNLRVIEGNAVNQAKYPLTRISIRGELQDASAVVIAERVVFCGNILSDQELGSMTEDEIQKELSQPQGSDVSNDRIEPTGQIPFMVVFAHEPPGVVTKAMVVPVAAERLLP